MTIGLVEVGYPTTLARPEALEPRPLNLSDGCLIAGLAGADDSDDVRGPPVSDHQLAGRLDAKHLPVAGAAGIGGEACRRDGLIPPGGDQR